MATREITVHVVDCDICEAAYEMDGITLHFATPEEAAEYVTEYGEWLRLDDGRLICRNADFVHDMARIPEVAI